ncbi:MAG: type II toxin-antitoxin system RelE/ParE family toxin, partial [Bacteroidota bacterium]
EDAFEQLTTRLSANPYQWQKLGFFGRKAHRAVLQSKYVILYQVVEAEKRVVILRLRGAAEDWTNQPLP